MEKQEIFNQAVRHLFKQGYKSEGWVAPDSDEKSCLYRGANGAMCAVGYFIPDEVYETRMEGMNVSSLWDEWHDVLPTWIGDNCELLTDLQHIHDNAEVQTDYDFDTQDERKMFVMDDLRKGLLCVMAKHRLEWPVLYSNLDALDALQDQRNLAHEAATNSQ